uniref:Apolipoprotein M n=1 Tax=Anguilla anguilla TaxID=7936 RepID=A0A0E9THL0_ANGAN
MDVLTVVAVLSLLSVSAAKPLNCEGLDQPLALNGTQISGKWIFIEGTTDHQKYATILKTVNSSFMDIVMSHNGTSVMKQKNMLNGKCHYSSSKYDFLQTIPFMFS